MATQQVAIPLDTIERMLESVGALLREVEAALTPYRAKPPVASVEGSAKRRTRPKGKLSPVKGGRDG